MQKNFEIKKKNLNKTKPTLKRSKIINMNSHAGYIMYISQLSLLNGLQGWFTYAMQLASDQKVEINSIQPGIFLYPR